ncbi:sensor histidine kinase [Kineococcus radiotolerans]|uniref:histidine kinase n=1 Tax=Kineococcus radiotolerans (strain ATCC BAA-149 / DSM 14245 / SRS30216) TaxID=266940 RepID=A6WBT2_KINRD|nr:HAMP domain-containing sensor histidine kinase [Kineococcus radiotolerans]ABS04271.1 integral membrane sensor signal transduction histidine kinase [Kineococcus radiotolerans SRS30216 = ATCC BAA-149]
MRLTTLARDRRRALRTVRSKVLAAVLAASGLGLALTGTVSVVLQRGATEVRAEASVRQEIDELRAFAAEGVDPRTGRPLPTVAELLRAKIESDVPDTHETALGIVAGGPTYASAVPPFDLNTPAVRAFAARLAPDAPAGTTVVRTDAGRTRVTAVPVTLTPADPAQPATGVYVVGHALDPEFAVVHDNARSYAVVALGALLLVAAVGYVVIVRLLRPLDHLHAAAVDVGVDDLSHRVPVHGDDDVADLARGFNGMLERLETSFETQRQFLDDAGHELRTPLTIVQGHLELLDVDDPRDVTDTRDLVLDELSRMTRLVDDLTLLAKARRPDFVTLQAVEAGRLLDDVYDKVVPLGERQWRVEERAEVTVQADGQRLTQAVLQLVSNAVKFTRPGDLIALGSAVRGGELHLRVRDSGPGIAAGDLDRIFERFGRAETGRGVEGSGLGLSIVTAIAEAHGGRVDVSSAPGLGSSFAVVLPLVPGPGPHHPPPTQLLPAAAEATT